MFILKSKQICPHKNQCTVAENCYGADEKRDSEFKCFYLELDQGQIKLNLPEQLRGNPNLTILHG